MNKSIVFAYIEGRPYQVDMTHDEVNRETTYEIQGGAFPVSEFHNTQYVPQEEKMMDVEERIRTVHDAEVAIIIWQNILNAEEG